VAVQALRQRPGPTEQLPRFRVLWLLVAAAVLAAAVWGRLAYWQVAKHEQLAQVARDQYTKVVPLPAERGTIYDAHMRPLVVNTEVYSVFVSPEQVPAASRDTVASALSGVLGVKQDDVQALLISGRKFAYVARRQPLEKAEKLRGLRLPGVGLQPEEQRSYLPGANPGTTLAANVLGFVDYEGAGRYGVEGYYNGQLAGKDGFVSTYQDLANREIVLSDGTRRDAVNGSDLQLTIDSSIQYAAEQAIGAAVVANKAESGSVLIMDPHTGGIVASASYPSFDANDFPHQDLARFQDPTADYLYEPGSVMKVVTLSGALDVHAITPTTSFYDPGYTGVGGYTIHDWDLKNHGTVTMTNVLEKSLNVGAIKAMQLEGTQAYFHYLQAFGFSSGSGIDEADEANVPLRSYDKWHDSEFATASFGQGIQVNMVQMLAAVNVVANGGKYAPPHLVERVGGVPNSVTQRPQPQVVTADTAKLMTQMMMSVVQNGSGYTARVPGFELDEAGKTGTSQMPENGGYSADHVWASYVGFLPAHNPRFTMLVVIRKPNNGSFDHNEGYYVSAPVWKQLAQAMVLQWGITPDPR
jgi:cell division protein FtsI/penicillin-binding protein 2